MKKWDKKTLISSGYELENAKIEDVALTMENNGVLTLNLTLNGCGWCTLYGGYALAKGYVGAKEFEGSEEGMEAIMRIMDVVEEEDLMNLKGKYVRVATKGMGSSIKIIGNIIKNKWFDYESFFEDKRSEQV